MDDALDRSDAEPLRIPGKILEDREWNDLAVVTQEDIQRLPEQWGRMVPPKYKHLISAETNEA